MNAGPLTLVIWGASGDLTARKLVPSLYRLAVKKRLPEELRLVGVARSPFTDDQFREKMAAAVKEFAAPEWSPQAWKTFAGRLFYVPGDTAKPDGLDGLVRRLKEHEGDQGGNRLYYLAVAPNLHEEIINRLDETGLSREDGGWRRVVIEKPFGHDLASARELNRIVRSQFREDQVFRIDHYLGKDTVQNILAMRFANIMYEPIWNRSYIDHVQITVAEKVSVENRGNYYDRAGVLRDMFQNHLFQLLTLVAMEAPARYAADTLRNEKVKVLDAVPILTVEQARRHLVTGQYQGYRSEKGVGAKTLTPTFAAMRLEIDNWRWHGVPFYLRSGKALARRFSEITVQFRSPPHLMFPVSPGAAIQCNRLSLCIQPDEGIHLTFQSKVPDAEGMALCCTEMEFKYRDAYPDVAIPESYERLLLDAIHGDAALFMRSDEIERAWEIMDPFLASSERDGAPQPEEYAVGSAGPTAADKLLAQGGRKWQPLNRHA